jgi:hypothetical protein
VVAEAAEDWGLVTTVEAGAPIRTLEDIPGLILQTAFESNVNGRQNSKQCMPSRQIASVSGLDIGQKRLVIADANNTTKGAYFVGSWGAHLAPEQQR